MALLILAMLYEKGALGVINGKQAALLLEPLSYDTNASGNIPYKLSSHTHSLHYDCVCVCVCVFVCACLCLSVFV